MNRKIIFRLSIIFGLFILLMPIVSLLATNEKQDNNLTIQEEYSKLHKVFIYKRGQVGNIASFDTYHMQLKQGKEYYFYTKINIEIGTFTFIVEGPGSSDHIEGGVWDQNTPKNERKIIFLFTATETGDHAITVGTIIASDGGNYTLYVNRSGFAGYWWMILIGIVALLVIIILPIALLQRRKKKKKKRKQKRK